MDSTPISKLPTMAGTIVITGANSSVGIPAVSHMLGKYPQHHAILTVRDASDSDVNTKRLRGAIARFANPKVEIQTLDLSDLSAVHVFADQISKAISIGQYPPICAIVANAYYWNLLDGPEITVDGFDKTLQVGHISHSALILRLLGSFGPQGRIIVLSADAHHPGKNALEKYAPALPADLDELAHPATDGDVQGRGFQRYANAKLASTTWMYALERRLQKDPALAGVTSIAFNPGNLTDSRALLTNTPPKFQRIQKYFLKPSEPAMRMIVGPSLRKAAPAGIDVIELALSPKYAGKRGYYTLLRESESSPDSHDEAKQERIWKETLEWGKITGENTALKLVA